MNCEETQKVFTLYLDGQLAGGAGAAAQAHLQVCPVCRLRLEQTRAVVRGLTMLERPAAPPDLVASINGALQIERAARASRPAPSLPALVLAWVRPRVMPYTVGALASVLLFFFVFSALRPQIAVFRELAAAAAAPTEAELAALAEEGRYDVTKPLTPANLATMRTPFSTESPSLNPRGALAALAWSPPSGLPGDDDMIVVADVYSNGSASLAAVMEPPRNPHMLAELEDALRKGPAFVPASLDRRPQTMRVVFVLQKMNVREASY